MALLLSTGLTAAVPGVGVGTASAQYHTSGTLADQWFRVEWSSTPNQTGGTTISGYVYNNHWHEADHIELRITELDAASWPTTSSVEPMTTSVPALNRTYFALKVPGRAASYRVAVESFDLVDGTTF